MVTWPSRIHDEGIAVEHQFVLPADQIDEDQGNPGFGDPRPGDLESRADSAY